MSAAKDASSAPRQPRAWATPDEVPEKSGVGEQIRHMRVFVAGHESGAEFARGWLAGRRSALAGGERIRAPFERILDDVFYVLEEYVIDPDLRDPDDMSDVELADQIRSAVQRLADL